MSRKEEKIIEIEKYLGELETLFPIELENYNSDFKIRAICERYFEKIVESAIDLAILIIKEKNLRKPKIEKESFDILVEAKIISQELCEKLKDAKGMRNVIAHEYGEIENELIVEGVQEHLFKTINSFLEAVR
jgi:uncharacterized protein YutE (UPF0331/DUF86 family)